MPRSSARRAAGQRRFHLSSRPGLVPMAMLGLLVLLAVVGPLVWTKPIDTVNVSAALEAPSSAHPMGTDEVGRDVFARFMRGAGISLAVGVIIALIGTLVGGAIGVLAGIERKWVDTLLMRLMDCLLAFPPLILAMAVTVGLGAGLETAAIGVTLTVIPYTARLVRSDVLRLRSVPFIEAAWALGATRRRVVLRHLLPSLVPTMLAQTSAVFGAAILAIAGLGFIGLGAQVPTPEWGTMITEGFQYVLTGAWWIGVFPGIGLLLAVTAFNALADDVRELLDPRRAR